MTATATATATEAPVAATGQDTHFGMACETVERMLSERDAEVVTLLKRCDALTRERDAASAQAAHFAQRLNEALARGAHSG